MYIFYSFYLQSSDPKIVWFFKLMRHATRASMAALITVAAARVAQNAPGTRWVVNIEAQNHHPCGCDKRSCTIPLFVVFHSYQ